MTSGPMPINALPPDRHRKPLTVADIPAGQGAASLFLTAEGGLRIRTADGSTEPVPYGVGLSQAMRDAIADHLAATLPTIEAYPPTTVDALAALIATHLRAGSDGDIIGLAYDLEDKLGADASDALWREAYALAAADPLFDTPQITTDDEGRHWHQGREYVAVDVDGELDYQPKETQP